MAFAIIFTPSGMNANKYDEVIKRLESAGAGSPKGKQYHVCYGDSNSLNVMDVWDTIENFEAFGQTLMPILSELGIDPGQPNVQPSHNIIVDTEAAGAR